MDNRRERVVAKIEPAAPDTSSRALFETVVWALFEL
jgi:hypothetical protein